MTECSIMVALSSVLSIIKIIDMPYGGSVTVASMLPIVIAVYRHGSLWGLGASLTYATVQIFLGLNTISFFTTWQSILAIVLLDYVIAFGVFALSGIFKRIEKRQNYAILYGIIFCSLLRYFCHVISGATLWAGLSIPTEAALIYSVSYNATYMLPDTIVLALVGIYLTSVIDFKSSIPTRVKKREVSKGELYATLGSGFLTIVTVIVDVCIIFPHLQNPDSGEFTLAGIKNSNIPLLITVSAIGIIGAVGLYVYSRLSKSKKSS